MWRSDGQKCKSGDRNVSPVGMGRYAEVGWADMWRSDAGLVDRNVGLVDMGGDVQVGWS